MSEPKTSGDRKLEPIIFGCSAQSGTFCSMVFDEAREIIYVLFKFIPSGLRANLASSYALAISNSNSIFVCDGLKAVESQYGSSKLYIDVRFSPFYGPLPLSALAERGNPGQHL